MASKPQLLVNEDGVLTNRYDEFFNIPSSQYLTSSVIWSDVNNDSWPDLISVGKWNPIIVHLSEEGQNFSSKSIPGSSGLWTSINGVDLDNDGDTDYIVGNQGLNSKYNLDQEHPIKLFAKDFDSNESIDLITSHFIDGEYRPYNLRNDHTKQLKSLSKVFKDYRSFADANTEYLLSNLDTSGMYYYQVETMENSILMNNGVDGFELKALPYNTQFSCMHGVLAKDLDADGYLDIISVGNDYGTEVFNGRTDAGYGNVILNSGGKLESLFPHKSNFYAEGNTRGIATYKSEGSNSERIVIARNQATPLLFELATSQISVTLPEDVFKVKTIDSQGMERTIEFYNGSSFLTQNSKNYFFYAEKIHAIYSINTKGEETEVYAKDAL